MPWFWSRSKDGEEESNYDDDDDDDEYEDDSSCHDDESSVEEEDDKSYPDDGEREDTEESLTLLADGDDFVSRTMGDERDFKRDSGEPKKQSNFASSTKQKAGDGSSLREVEFQSLLNGKAIINSDDEGVVSSSDTEEFTDTKERLVRERKTISSSPNDANSETPENGDSHVVTDDNEENDNDEDDMTTSFSEKQTVLALAAEHDRVDIIQSILNPTPLSPISNNAVTPKRRSNINSSSSDNNETDKVSSSVDEDETRSELEMLLNPDPNTAIPPLHLALSYGAVNAVNCLLRMGADPSIRPNASEIQNYLKQQQSDNSQATLNIVTRFDDLSAWELVFGNGIEANAEKSKWSLFGASSSNLSSDDDNGNNNKNSTERRRRKKAIKSIDIPIAKRNGIHHAFTAEALRAIGSDEVDRVKQLVDAGMPTTTEIGAKSLYQWSVDMDSKRCQQYLAPDGDINCEENSIANTTTPVLKTDESIDPFVSTPKKSAVLDRTVPGVNDENSTVTQLRNRFDELQSLSKALHGCLDNLAEEVSVCSGLLLVGSGATALASHVRTLKATKQRKYDELLQLEDSYERSLDELEYWIKEFVGSENDLQQLLKLTESASAMAGKKASTDDASSLSALKLELDPAHLDNSISQSISYEEDEEETELKEKHQLKAQIIACENKIRQLRASIGDLSEENARNLAEVESRGLLGGVTLVRSIRDEIREIEFAAHEVQSDKKICQQQISAIRQYVKETLREENKQVNISKPENDKGQEIDHTLSPKAVEEDDNDDAKTAGTDDASTEKTLASLTPSEMQISQMESGHEMTLRDNRITNKRPLFALLQIILRIIGLQSTGSVDHTQIRNSTANQSSINISNSSNKNREQENRYVMII